jgi:beta-phosphoglucomutase family hydrolase
MNFDGVIFDMDGVVTKTADVHAAAWKMAFDEYLQQRQKNLGEPFRAFTRDDYLDYVDGKPRFDGIKSFLQSRGIQLISGTPEDKPETESIYGLGNRKNGLFRSVLETDGVDVYPSTLALIEKLRSRGVKIGLATSSMNCAIVLEKAGIEGLFATCVDGVIAAERSLRGKPQPDIFVAACDNIGIEPDRATIVEDAISGVRAGAVGRFGLTLGVAREKNGAELRRNGADLVVSDLAEIDIDDIDAWFKQKTNIRIA